MDESRYKEWTDEGLLDFIEDLNKETFRFSNEGDALEAVGMCVIVINNIIRYLRRLQGKVNE